MSTRLSLLAIAGVLSLSSPTLRSAETSSLWTVPAPRLVKEAYFSNLADRASIDTPYLLKFGLTGVGLAPIVKAVAGTGHHHLLVNRELPMDFGKPLPFNEQYIHFGKGQMETVLNFAPGTYTLRLVLADERHIPNFVYSKPITITVKKKSAEIDARSLVKPGVEILSPQPGTTTKAPFRLALHASGLNVANTALADKGNGHFRVRIKSAEREELISLSNGFTEIWLNPPAGNYTALVEFIDNSAPDKVLATGAGAVAFRVER
ncbi:MAG: DUF4399 domain-containing protein [Burkholderiales bacterium]|nr:DUF4399 domain-containing protein [Burkholderiales bacterium]